MSSERFDCSEKSVAQFEGIHSSSSSSSSRQVPSANMSIQMSLEHASKSVQEMNQMMVGSEKSVAQRESIHSSSTSSRSDTFQEVLSSSEDNSSDKKVKAKLGDCWGSGYALSENEMKEEQRQRQEQGERPLSAEEQLGKRRRFVRNL